MNVKDVKWKVFFLHQKKKLRAGRRAGDTSIHNRCSACASRSSLLLAVFAVFVLEQRFLHTNHYFYFQATLKR